MSIEIGIELTKHRVRWCFEQRSGLLRSRNRGRETQHGQRSDWRDPLQGVVTKHASSGDELVARSGLVAMNSHRYMGVRRALAAVWENRCYDRATVPPQARRGFAVSGSAGTSHHEIAAIGRRGVVVPDASPIMNVLLLNGATGPDLFLDEVAARVRHDFEARGATVETVLLRIESVSWCQGCFECWTHTPGVCKINDAGRDLAREFVLADVVVLLTPSRFGGYSHECKKLLDRTIGMLLPFFRRVEGETHHPPRYTHRPAFGVFAVLDHEDFDATCTLRVLVERNAMNFASPRCHLEIVQRDQIAGVVLAACDRLVDALLTPPVRGERLRHPDDVLPAMARWDADAPPREALVLVGSSKPRGTSTSESLGSALLERLSTRGVRGRLAHVHRDAHDARGLTALTASLRGVDLLILATPVYIDALPWLLTRALDALARDRAATAHPSALAVTMLANCGFPEARHAAIARTIGALFARDARARWAGALQLGAGALINGSPITAAGHLVRPLRPLLDQAADSLARGERLEDETIQGFQEPRIPALAYAAAGDATWLWTAAHEGALRELWAKPFEKTW